MLGVAGEKKPAAQFKDMAALTTYPATVTLGVLPLDIFADGMEGP